VSGMFGSCGTSCFKHKSNRLFTGFCRPCCSATEHQCSIVMFGFKRFWSVCLSTRACVRVCVPGRELATLRESSVMNETQFTESTKAMQQAATEAKLSNKRLRSKVKESCKEMQRFVESLEVLLRIRCPA
jgi:hypothetical protein